MSFIQKVQAIPKEASNVVETTVTTLENRICDGSASPRLHQIEANSAGTPRANKVVTLRSNFEKTP